MSGGVSFSPNPKPKELQVDVKNSSSFRHGITIDVRVIISTSPSTVFRILYVARFLRLDSAKRRSGQAALTGFLQLKLDPIWPMLERESMEMHMPMVETNEDVTAEKELRSNLLRAGPTNPALQRLQQRLLEVTDASQVITSYDRMHHRHSRS